MRVSSPHLIRFGLFEVDTRSGELRRQGSKVNLQEQPFQALVLLLERPGEVVTREELNKRLWPENTFVDFERGLNKAINKLRAALRDDAEKPRFIETLPQHGYRFIAPLEGALPASAPKSADQDAPGANLEAIGLTIDKPAAEVPAPPGTRPQKQRVWLAFVACAFLVALFVGFNVGGLRQRFLGRPDPSGIRSLAVLPLENLPTIPSRNTLPTA
jgi:DNA-binding winged helix-turn-helix (wHTH) protein